MDNNADEHMEELEEPNDTSHQFDRKIVCVKYPGIVKDKDKMITTLGGIKKISTVLSDPNRRLELRFRPDDPHSKPAYGDPKPVTGLLLKIRVPKRARSSNEDIPISYTVLGKVTESYAFKTLNDFQYLPQKSGPLPQQSIRNEILPRSLPPLSWLDNQNTPSFLLPATLSRIDNPNVYCFRTEAAEPSAKPMEINLSTYKSRKNRSNHTEVIPYDNVSVPQRPKPKAIEELGKRSNVKVHLEKLKKMFSDRPIWSRSALRFELKPKNSNDLKLLLPCVAYYFQSGPWRTLWVRLGYDPRVEPEARKYQTLDYRARSEPLQGLMKSRKRTRNIKYQYKTQPRGNRMSLLSRAALQSTSTNRATSDDEKFEDENVYKFKPNFIPANRQMLYQFCDIEIPEIKKMLEKTPEPGATCQERFGWLSSTIYDETRERLDNIATATAEKLLESSNIELPSKSDSSDSEGSIDNDLKEVFSNDEADDVDDDDYTIDLDND